MDFASTRHERCLMTKGVNLTRAILKTLTDAVRSRLDERGIANGSDNDELIKAMAWLENKNKVHSKPKKRKLSATTRAWLKHLERHGPQTRRNGKVAVECQALGYTEWDITLSDGTPISEEEATARYGDEWPKNVKINDRERITQTGRELLVRRRTKNETDSQN